MQPVTHYKRRGSSFGHEESDQNFSSQIYIVCDDSIPVFERGYSYYVYVHQISSNGAKLELYKGMSFPLAKGTIFRTSPNEKFRLIGVDYGLVIKMKNVNDIFQINPFFETEGRLKYIDGCMDTLILSPIISGFPCLSSLFFPHGVKQTIHIHPSFRIGMVVSGEGYCVTPGNRIHMCSGDLIIVHTGGLHSFETEQSPMTLISFHPDSEFGPSDLSHPMIDKTIIEGKSAVNYSEILTK